MRSCPKEKAWKGDDQLVAEVDTDRLSEYPGAQIMLKTSLRVGLCLLLVGCASPNSSKQPVDEYLSQYIERVSGKPVVTASIPELKGVPWKAREDKYGVIVEVHGNKFEPVDRWFRATLGSPWNVQTNDVERPSAIFVRTNAYGVHVSYSFEKKLKGNSSGVCIAILKPSLKRTSPE